MISQVVLALWCVSEDLQEVVSTRLSQKADLRVQRRMVELDYLAVLEPLEMLVEGSVVHELLVQWTRCSRGASR